MNQEQILKLEESIQKMRDKKSRIYFIVQDTKGNAKASIRYIYEMAMSLKNNGFNAIILHETPEYFGVTDWLGEEYMTNLDHKSIEGTNLEISPEDLIVIPEIYGFIMDQINYLVVKLCYHNHTITFLKHYNLDKLGLNLDSINVLQHQKNKKNIFHQQ